MYLEDASTVIVLKTPKTESSVRKVWMPKTVAYILGNGKRHRTSRKNFSAANILTITLWWRCQMDAHVRKLLFQTHSDA